MLCFYLSCPSTQLYFDKQKKLKSLFWNLVHLVLLSSLLSPLSNQSVINTHNVLALSWPQHIQRRRKRISRKQGAPPWCVKDFARGLKGPRGCLCCLVLEDMRSNNSTTSTSVQTLVRAKISREVESWQLVKRSSIMRCWKRLLPALNKCWKPKQRRVERGTFKALSQLFSHTYGEICCTHKQK